MLPYCLRRTADAALAEDLVSSSSSRLAASGDLRAGADADLRPWLYGIATNATRQHRRSRCRRAAALSRIDARVRCGESAAGIAGEVRRLRIPIAEARESTGYFVLYAGRAARPGEECCATELTASRREWR